MEDLLSVAQTLNAIRISQDTHLSVIRKVKEVMEQQGTAVMRLLDAIPGADPQLGQTIDIRV